MNGFETPEYENKVVIPLFEKLEEELAAKGGKIPDQIQYYSYYSNVFDDEKNIQRLEFLIFEMECLDGVDVNSLTINRKGILFYITRIPKAHDVINYLIRELGADVNVSFLGTSLIRYLMFCPRRPLIYLNIVTVLECGKLTIFNSRTDLPLSWKCVLRSQTERHTCDDILLHIFTQKGLGIDKVITYDSHTILHEFFCTSSLIDDSSGQICDLELLKKIVFILGREKSIQYFSTVNSSFKIPLDYAKEVVFDDDNDGEDDGKPLASREIIDYMKTFFR